MIMPKTVAILVGRLIFAGVFLMAASFKLVFMGIPATANEIAAQGIANPIVGAWLAAFLELVLACAFLTGLFFTDAAIVAIAYVIFLGVLFHGPNKWSGNPMEFGFFVDHFTFVAGLLFAAVHGPGDRMVLGRDYQSARRT